MLCYEAVGYDVFLFVLVRTVRIGIVIHIKSSLTKETVCGTTASQVMRCVSWEGSNPDNWVDTANPKTSVSQFPLKGIFFLQGFFRDLSLHLSLFYISQIKNLTVVGLVAVLALPDEVGFLLGFGGSHSLPQARHAHQPQQSPDPQFQFPSLFCWNVHCYTWKESFLHFTAIVNLNDLEQIYLFSSHVFSVQKGESSSHWVNHLAFKGFVMMVPGGLSLIRWPMRRTS